MTSIVQSAGLIFLLTLGSASGQPQTNSSPTACPAPQNSADYVPGIDVQGHKVAPADLPDTSDVKVGDKFSAQVRTKNPQIPSVNVTVKMNGLDSQPCKPAPGERPVDASIHIH